MAIPLTARGRVLGALQFVRTDPARADFTAEDLALIEELGRRTSTFVDNAYLYQDAEEARERAEAIANSLAEHVERLSAVEAQLKSAVRLRDDFLSVASHELKTPLTTLRLQVDGLRRHGPGRDPMDDERTRTSLARIHSQLGRLERLVEELLDVSRIQAGHLELRPEPLDLGELAVEVVGGVPAAPGLRRADPACSAQPGVIGHWDRARLDQILTNLLSNALKYGRDLPVEVSIRADEAGAVVVVSDQGIGIPPAEQKRVFERFERAAPPEHYGGLGLGLWIVREIIEAMGGTIALDSRVDEGSTFTVRLPPRGLGTAAGRAGDEAGGSGRFDLVDHLIDGQHLGEGEAQHGAGGPLQDVPGHAAHVDGGGAVAEEEDPEVAHVGLAGGGLGADVGGDAGDDDAVDAARAQDQLQVGAVEGAEAGLVEHDVARLDLQILVEGGGEGALGDHALAGRAG